MTVGEPRIATVKLRERRAGKDVERGPAVLAAIALEAMADLFRVAMAADRVDRRSALVQPHRLARLPPGSQRFDKRRALLITPGSGCAKIS